MRTLMNKISKMKKRTKVTLTSLLLVFFIIIAALLYINLTNLEVNSQLRINGFIYNILLSADDEESIVKFSKSSKKLFSPELKSDDTATVEEKYIKTRDGKDLKIFIFKPVNPEPNATGVLWLHGGGYAIGAANQEFGTAKSFIKTANTVFVTPDYTLSPDAPYPAALNDCYDTLVWMKENASLLGINENQLFVGGSSAGGGLTAAVTLYARDHDDVNVAFQMPLYPMLNDKMDTPSEIGNTALVWNSKKNHAAWSLYLGDLFGSNHVPKYASAVRETDYSGLPPTFTFVGDLEPFYDDTIAYAHNLMADGVNVEYYVYKGAYHGFDGIAPKADISKDARNKLLAAYKYATENYFAEQPTE